jgi:hypothetical protein
MLNLYQYLYKYLDCLEQLYFFTHCLLPLHSRPILVLQDLPGASNRLSSFPLVRTIQLNHKPKLEHRQNGQIPDPR